jgi:hypothetical protein
MADQSIATPEENASLEHSKGGATTRQDGTDAGVPMLQGDPGERQGPEDALGPGPKRGDYSTRLGDQYNPHIAVKGADGLTRLVPQTSNASERGENRGIKGGVDMPAAERSMASAPALAPQVTNGGYDPASLPALPWAANAAPGVAVEQPAQPERNQASNQASAPAEPAPRPAERAPIAPVEQPAGGGVEVHNETADKGNKSK